ncbi:MAG: hypothetical protein QY318_03945 [Candidatus Dojkabacteria bacterium]|nr:MAG: hypothetical protein QY318_03945 [Candidatus Dojkabacteria bacterium]
MSLRLTIGSSTISTIFKAIFVLILIVGYAAAISGGHTFINKASAYETTCPPEMDEFECIDFLQQQIAMIGQERSALNSKLSKENYDQLSLSGKIAYYNNKVAATEKSIEAMEADIQKNNLELQILDRDIRELGESINTASQEVNKLQNSIKKRVRFSYKYSSYSPVEIIFSTPNLDDISRKLKYLQYTKEKDKEMLEGMSEQIAILTEKKEVLANKEVELEEKRDEIELKKISLSEERNNLNAEKTTQQGLLAESRLREEQYLASLSELQGLADGITRRVTQLILEAYQSGQLPANTPVEQGDIVGFQGHTGFAYGSHLHFEYSRHPFQQGRLNGGVLYQPVTSGTLRAPLDGGVLTQGFHLSLQNWYSIDLQSRTYGDQSGATYTVQPGQVCCFGTCVPATNSSGNPIHYNMRGEGAPVRAVKAGMFTGVRVDMCGGKYAIVDHGGGDLSLYLHLR